MLFMCPVVPAADRNGLAMRAGVSVEALGRFHDLTVAVVRSPFDDTPPGWARGHAKAVVETLCVTDHAGAMSWLRSARGRRVARHDLPAMVRFRPPAVGEWVIDQVGCAFDAVVVMGTYVAGAALPFLDRGVTGLLDAFDDDARTHVSLARLDPSCAEEIPRYEAFQHEVFPWFERVLFASREDAVPPFVHLPNAVRVPATPSMCPFGTTVRLLFVGHSGYMPNRDAVARLRGGILPAVRQLGLPVQLLRPAVDEDVSPFYERAHVAVVPLRAAGGTRIKILEAFAHGCPVVSTPTGARGLGVTSGEHLLITADDDDDSAFAQAIVGLMADEERRKRIAATARAFVAENHDHRDVGRRLATIVEECVATRS